MAKLTTTNFLSKLLEEKPDIVNFLTEYPSILTYHKMGEKGSLLDELSFPFGDGEEKEIFVTEKVDGVNTRIVIYKDDFIIGSRAELIYAKGDRVISKSQSIVKTVLDEVRGFEFPQDEGGVYVVYGEVYGNKITKSKAYTDENLTNFRIFDIRIIPKYIFEEIDDPNVASNYRNSDKDRWVTYTELTGIMGSPVTDMVPILNDVVIKDMSIEEAYNFTQKLVGETTRAYIDTPETKPDGPIKGGRPEGIVIRSDDRKYIAKLRYEDYERTLGIKHK